MGAEEQMESESDKKKKKKKKKKKRAKINQKTWEAKKGKKGKNNIGKKIKKGFKKLELVWKMIGKLTSMLKLLWSKLDPVWLALNTTYKIWLIPCTPEIDLGWLGTIPSSCALSVSISVNPIGIFDKIAGFIGLVLKFVLSLFKPLLDPIKTKIDELKEQALNELQKKFNDAFDFDKLLVLPKMYQQLSIEKIKKIKDDILEAIPINKMIAAATAVGAQIMNMGPKIGAMCGEGKKVQRFKVTGSGCKLTDGGTCFESSVKFTYKKAYVQLARNTVCTTLNHGYHNAAARYPGTHHGTGVIRTVAECKEALRSLGLKVPNVIFINDKGGGGCDRWHKCNKCEGDCDADNDCAGSLKCFQRENGETVPGCSVGGPHHYDFCYSTSDVAVADGIGMYNGAWTSIPSGCSNNGHDEGVHFNAIAGSGGTRSDLAPICSINIPINHYGPNERCSIKVLTPGEISTHRFNTEYNYDKLTIVNRNLVYHGITGPSDVSVYANDMITWSSDGGSERTGFKICTQSAEALKIDRLRTKRVPLQPSSSYDCPTKTWTKRTNYRTHHYTLAGDLCTISYADLVKDSAYHRHNSVYNRHLVTGQYAGSYTVAGSPAQAESACVSKGGTWKYQVNFDRSLYTCIMHPTKLKACIGECKSDAHCASGLKCMERKWGESVPGCTGRGQIKHTTCANVRDLCARYSAKYRYDPSYNHLSGNYFFVTGMRHYVAQNQACVGECDDDGDCAKVDNVQLTCFQREAGGKVPGCVGEGKELDGGKPHWDYCVNPVKVKQAADAAAAQAAAQEAAEEAAEAKERAADIAAAKASEESSKRKAAIAATKVSEEISKRKAIYDAKALAKAIKKARFCHNKPADTLFYDEGSATACLAPVAKKVCKDKPGFTNGYGHGCQNYVKHGWCKNGAFVAGQKWTGGVRFKFPENSCCACNHNLKQGAVQSYPMPDTTTWAQAKTQCESYGKTMCSRAAICPNGKLKPPFGGTRSGDVWVPTDGTDGTDTSTNEWTSIGTQSVGVRLCKTHKDGLGSSPGWGTTTTSHAFRKEVLCCGGSKIFLYGKSACENQCKPRGTYNNGSPPAACTAVYCDQYKPGKRFASRCIPGDPGHTYAKSECQSTCNICPK